jgi:hypothetical protein
MHCHLLITGPSGSGKSFYADQLSKTGYPAFDADAIPGLAKWFDHEGEPVAVPRDLSESFLRQHRYLWDRDILSSFLRLHPVALVFGISHNSEQLAYAFDCVMLLELPVEQVLANLASAGRVNAFGSTPEHRTMARIDTEAYYENAPSNWPRLRPSHRQDLVAAVEATLGHSLPRVHRPEDTPGD